MSENIFKANLNLKNANKNSKNKVKQLSILNAFKTHKFLIVSLLIMLLLSVIYTQIVSYTASKFNGITIVLDAGHGGRDGGSVGANGTIEKTINLEYTLLLKDRLVNAGYRVILTRKNDDGLYNAFAKNKKLSDMNERFKIIKKANPNLVVSIHMNSFKNSSARGASTYYRQGDKASQTVGDLIQKSLHASCNANYTNSKVGDYYILNCSYYTSVLIECGFISNPNEEALLNSKEYKLKFVEAVFDGIFLYFGNNSI